MNEFENAVRRAAIRRHMPKTFGDRLKQYLVSRDGRETIAMFAVIALFILALCLPI